MPSVFVMQASPPPGPTVYFTETSATGIGTGYFPTDGAVGVGDFFYLTLTTLNTYERWNPPYATITGDVDRWTITPRSGTGGESAGKTLGEGLIDGVAYAGFNRGPGYTDVSPYFDGWTAINGAPPP